MRDGHLYRALGWRLWWSFRRKWLPILVCTLIPILMALFLAWISSKLTPKTEQKESKPKSLGSDFLSKSSTNSMKVGYSPENDVTKAIMEEVRKKISNGNFTSGKSEEDVEKELSKESSSKTAYGIVFKESSKSRLSYSLRSTENLWFTDTLFSFDQSPPSASKMYFERGFIALQTAINSAYLKYLGVNEEKWSLQEFPYPSYTRYPSFEIIQGLIIFFMIVGLLPLMFYMMNNVLKEKSSGAKELMLLNGLKLYLIYAYWMIFFSILFLIAITSIVIIFKISWNNGAVFNYSNGFLLWLLLILYAIASMALIFFICSLLTNFSFAFNAFLLLIMTIYITLAALKTETVSVLGIISLLFPIGAVYHGLQLIISYEITGVGFGFGDIISRNNGYGPYLLIISALIISTIIFLLISIYISLIKPGEYGKAKPWHFILPRYAKNIFKVEKENEVDLNHETKTPIVEPVKASGDIQVRNLYKIYKSFYALNNFSIDIYNDQITALLGHNGAGKSTFLFTITGIISPSSGQIIYDDYDIFTDMERFRESFGFCPQQDMVLDDLSAKEQVMFFGMLKKIYKKDASQIADDFFNKFNMSDKSHLLPKKMSGGMKRKLCLAIAIANNPPSLREGRIIVVTTHFMEEANVLGDRIAIMANGELRCYGSAMFLKKHYGYGHNIVISYMEKNPEEIKKVVLFHINTEVKDNQSLKQISFNVPMEKTSKLSKLITDLTNIVERNQINVTSSSLEKVFLKVNESEGITTEFEENDIQYLVQKRDKNSGRTILIMLLLNLLFKDVSKNDPPLNLNLNKYGSTVALIGGSDENKMAKNFQNEIVKSGSTYETGKNAVDELMKVAEKDKTKFRKEYVVAGNFEKSSTILYSSFAYHSAPIAVNHYYNAYLQKVKSGTSIDARNEPYDFSNVLCRKPWVTEDFIMIWIFLLTILLTSLASHTMLPTKERVSGIKHLQNNAGVDPVTYWVSNLMFDIVLYTVVLAIIVLIILLMDTTKGFVYSDVLGALFVLLFCFSLSVILLCYLFSLLFNSSNASYTIIVLGLILLGKIVYLYSYSTYFTALAIYITALVAKGKVKDYLYLTNIINTYSLALGGLSDINDVAGRRIFCKTCPNEEHKDECKESNESLFTSKSFMHRIYWLLGNSALLILLILLIDYKIIQYPIYKANTLIYKSGQEQKEDDDVHNEKQKIKNYLNKKRGKTLRLDGGAGSSQSSNSESGSKSLSNEEENPVLLVDELTKKYKNFVAANSVSFAALKGECFGLLGVSGAGKSTVFGMLTGTKYPTKGSAYIVDKKFHELKIIGYGFINKIGYCPQEHCLIDKFSSRQLMTIFANLRGIKDEDVDTMVEWWINMLDLHNYSDKPCGNYSGGNKRKLSTALALIGQPILIFLDEPTTGVDPVARRKLWQIFNLIKYTEQTMVLTSHSMDECEAVCNRLTIMAKGKMMCIGEISYIKHKFAVGCTIYLKLNTNPPIESIENLKNAMISKFGPTLILEDEYQGFLHYQLGDKNIKWEEIFSIMEKIKMDFEILEEYMMSDTSLEQVFLSFAKNQENV